MGFLWNVDGSNNTRPQLRPIYRLEISPPFRIVLIVP